KALHNIPAPDEKATELRERLSTILTQMVAYLNNTKNEAPRQPAPLPQEQIDRYNAWRKDYNQWLKSAAPKRQR
ncbi:MAG TPA: hypothetical protein VLB68_00130, partial [Pyrinomonadaceae bacterium]|nr:hypothetical protein [Pyrinomonadaceae bacterium]